MVRCKDCPIVKECNKDAIFVNMPVKWDKGKPIKFQRQRLWPLVVALATMKSNANVKGLDVPGVD